MVPATYQATVGSSGKLKLKAKARLASGTDDDVFDACVLLHEAARFERHAVAALVDAPAATRFAARVEECACLVEGLDPVGAARVWSKIRQAESSLDPVLARALLDRLTSRYQRLQRSYATTLAGTTTLRQMFASHRMVPASDGERRRAAHDVAKLNAAFPGVASLWWTAYRLADAAGDIGTAWAALARARLLEPDNKRFEAIALLAATRALGRDAAEDHIARVRGQLTTAGPEICLMYSLAELRLASSGPAPERAARWESALRAAQSGRAQGAARKLSDNLRAVELLAESYIRGTSPSIELLYLAGLGEVAARVRPADDLLELLTTEGVERLSRSEAA